LAIAYRFSLSLMEFRFSDLLGPFAALPAHRGWAGEAYEGSRIENINQPSTPFPGMGHHGSCYSE
jgi:hypothetical protein